MEAENLELNALIAIHAPGKTFLCPKEYVCPV